MPVAKGMSLCRSEWLVRFQSFYDQIQLLNDAREKSETSIQNSLSNIELNKEISKEEKDTLRNPLYEALNDLREKIIRVRGTMIMGIYSAWEIALMQMSLTAQDKLEFKVKITSGPNHNRFSDYLKGIFGDQLPASIQIISTHIRELRNYLVHGSLTPNRRALINDLMGQCKYPVEKLNCEIDLLKFTL